MKRIFASVVGLIMLAGMLTIGTAEARFSPTLQEKPKKSNKNTGSNESAPANNSNQEKPANKKKPGGY